MTVAIRDIVTFGHGQSSTVNTQSFTMPAGVQDGDVAILTLNAASGGGVVPTLTSSPAEWGLPLLRRHHGRHGQ
jgi:phage FluMu protein gp41